MAFFCPENWTAFLFFISNGSIQKFGWYLSPFLVVLLATFSTIGLPAEGLAFIAGIDRILDMGRTAVNVVGNSLAAIVVSKWEGQFNPPSELENIKKAS